MHDIDRFKLLSKLLNFSDNSLKTKNTLLILYKPLLDELLRKFQQLYTPESAVVYDESLIQFRCRLNFKQHIPVKSQVIQASKS